MARAHAFKRAQGVFEVPRPCRAQGGPSRARAQVLKTAQGGPGGRKVSYPSAENCRERPKFSYPSAENGPGGPTVSYPGAGDPGASGGRQVSYPGAEMIRTTATNERTKNEKELILSEP